MQKETDGRNSADRNALKSEYDKYKCTFELATDAIFTGNSEGEFTGVNESAIQMTGYSRSELLIICMSSLFSESDLNQKPLRYDLHTKGVIVKAERERLKNTIQHFSST